MNKQTLGDHLSRLITTAFDVLLKNPLRTTLGLLLGVVFEILTKIFSPLIDKLIWIDLSRLIIWHYIALGIFILHIQPLFCLFFHKLEINEDLEKIFKIIKIAKKEGVSEQKIEQIYLDICEKVIQNVEINEIAQKNINKLNKFITEQEKP